MLEYMAPFVRLGQNSELLEQAAADGAAFVYARDVLQDARHGLQEPEIQRIRSTPMG